MSPATKESSFPFFDQSACRQKAHAKEDALALPVRANFTRPTFVRVSPVIFEKRPRQKNVANCGFAP